LGYKSSLYSGLDYPGIGPEHSQLKISGSAEYNTVANEEVLAAFQELSRVEGIILALESAHAVAYTIKLAPTLPKDHILIVNISGRGDKDVEQVFHMLNK
jgi:tryptophan synthase beta chain